MGDTRKKGDASTTEFPSDAEFDEEADAIASRIEFERTLREPNKLLQLDLLTIAQMTDEDAWKRVVHPALEQYLMKYYPAHHTQILIQVKCWSLPELLCYLREPGTLTETIQTDGDETATTNFTRVLVHASLDEKRTDGYETTTTNFIRVLVPLLQVPAEFRRM